MVNPKLWLGRLFAVALAVAAVSALPATAQDASTGSTPATESGTAHDVAEGVAHETAEHVEGGLPQLNTATYPTQLFWLAVTFGTLLVLMSKVALPRVGEVLEARQEKIASDLDKAASFKAEADGVIAAYEKALADARGNAQKVMAEASAASDAAAAKRQAELAVELASRSKEAEGRIAAAKQTALENVRAVATETAQAAVARLAGVDVDAGTAGAAVETALKERA
ncbi:MAG TPA: ATPase [Azospirillaceae bacterium]|nr:ATPase [Azospirillaceae bacterium]